VGLIAQDVQQVCPNAIIERSDGLIAVDYKKLIPYMIKAIQSLQAQIDHLNERIQVLEDNAK
jgi:hypothetical protein